MARAVMEGVSYALYSSLELIRAVGIDVSEMALCGGGAKSGFWRTMLTDLYEMPTAIRESTEGAALGAAILGGCAAGVYTSVGDGCARAVRDRSVAYPDGARHAAYLRYYELYQSLYPCLKDAFRALQGV